MEAPKAKIIPTKRTINGVDLEDNYAWLRDKENPEVIKYLEDENKYTEAYMGDTSDFQESLFEELKGRIKETDQTYPVTRDGYLYYTRTEKGKNYPIYCRKRGNMEAEEQVYLDCNQLAEGLEYFRLGGMSLSPDQRFLAYSTDVTGYEIYTIEIKDLQSGQKLADKIENVAGDVLWTPNGDFLIYDLLDDIHRPFAVYYHKVGGENSEDKLIYQDDDNQFFVSFSKSRDKKYFYISSTSQNSNETRYARFAQNTSNSPFESELEVFMARRDKIEYNISHHEGDFYITTNENAVNFEVFKTKVESPEREKWETVIPHNINVQNLGVSSFKSHLVFLQRKGGFIHMEVRDLEKGETWPIKFPEDIYSVWTGANPEYESKVLRLHFSSPITPSITYDYDIEKRELLLRKQEEVKGYEPKNYVTFRKYATAKDGTRVPLSIAHHKDLKYDGQNPTLLYGYGSYGYSIDPGFATNMLSLLERGMIFVIAHIRGGGEMGKPWYEDGKFLHKKNTFEDFISAAEYLVSERLTNSGKLAIMGGSAGGLLMGAVVNMRPDLFKVVVARVPFVDVINTMLDPSIPLTTAEYKEWGNPNEKDFFDYMLSYSPYNNVEAKNYPSMLVTAGLNDPRVHYWEPSKWVAKLRNLKTDNNILLLKTNMGAGHGGASGRYDSLKETAFIYTFILKELGILK